MATHSGSEPFTAEQARDAMGLLDTDNARLAARLVTPWWYHVVLGGLVALMSVGTILPGSAGLAAIALAVVSLVGLPVLYRRRYGVSVTEPAGPRSRHLMHLLLGVFAVAFFSGPVLDLSGVDTRWVLLPAGLAWGLTVALGRRYDEALRCELRGGDRR